MNKYPWLDEYLLSKLGAMKDFKAEWEWECYRVGGKMFAATMHPSAKHAPKYAEKDLLNLKCDPPLAELLRKEHPEVLPGFYSDKCNWNSVNLEGEVQDALLRQMCDDSYALVFAKLAKKAQREILAQ